MLGPTIADLLPAAVAVALSPIPIVAIVVVLGSRRGRLNGVAFAFGWVLGLVVVSALVVGLLGGADQPDSGPATAASVGRVVLGLALLVLAVRTWRSRPRGDAEPEMPAWMDSVEHLQPPRALALGLALSGLNPKNLALTAVAAASIAQAGLDGTDTVLAIAVFVVVGSLSVAGAVVAALVAPDATRAPLASVKAFMAHHNAVIMMVILLIFGVKLVADGAAALLG